jgi:hypothetical protein
MGKATGPRTTKGKARASQNAAKHWIESGRILPHEEREAAILRNGFIEDFKPEGASEHEVIDDLVFNRLTKRRIDIAFTREFSKANIQQMMNWMENQERSGALFPLRSDDVRGKHRAGREWGERLRPDLCIGALEALRQRIGDHGPRPEDLSAFCQIYGDEPTENAAWIMSTLREIADERAVDETANTTGHKEDILEMIEAEIERQKLREELSTDIDAIEWASDIQEPPGPTLETLLRYRAANTREFKDLLGTLELIRQLRRSTA